MLFRPGHRLLSQAGFNPSPGVSDKNPEGEDGSRAGKHLNYQNPEQMYPLGTGRKTVPENLVIM